MKVSLGSGAHGCTPLSARVLGFKPVVAALSLLLAGVLSLGGICGATAGVALASEAQDGSSAAEEQASSAAEEEETRTQYPLEVTYYGLDGEETVTFDKAPERVFVAKTGNIETMLALGLEDRIVGVSGVDCEMPDSLKDAFEGVNDLGVYCPDEESILELEPDFIYAPKWLFMNNETSLDEWFDRGINVYIDSNWNNDMDAPRTLENEYNDILTIGKIFDVQDRAEALVDQLKSQVSEIESRIEGQDSPRVMILFPDSEQLFANYSELDLAGNLAEELGATLAVGNVTSVGREEIVEADPDVIIVLYSSSVAQAEEDAAASAALDYFNDSAYANVTAVKEGHVYALSDGMTSVPGAGCARSVLAMAECLYPDVDFSDIEV
jgi:iron complex transport system substrate-binding protein